MAGPLLVFISHSSKDRALTEQLCAALRDESVEPACCEPVVDFHKLADYDLLVDFDELQAGRPWPKQLHEWMARCHGAVLLLTKQAIRSAWVLKEATILAWRLSLDPSFRFIVVQAPDVSDDELRAAGFDPLMLGEIQKVQLRDMPGAAAEIRKTLGPHTAERTPFDALCGALQDLLQRVESNTMRQLAETMRVDPPQWRPDRDLRQQYVHAIAAKLLNEDLGGFDGVHELVNLLLNTTASDTVSKLLYIAAPHWVDAQSAGRLPGLARSVDRRAVAMTGLEVFNFTAEMYVRRAHPLSRLHRVLGIPDCNGGDVVDHVTRELYLYARRDKGRPAAIAAAQLEPEQLAEVIRHFARDLRATFVVLSGRSLSGTGLQTLLARFPKLTFILASEDEAVDVDPLTTVALRPSVDPDMELRQLDAYETAMALVSTQ